MKKKPKKLKTEIVKEIFEITICKTDFFFDVIAEGKSDDLNRLRQVLKLETDVLEKGVFGKPVIVLDTADDFVSAKHLMKEEIRRINKEFK